MVYPSEFSAAARTRVELEETQASQDFNQSRENLPRLFYGPGAELHQLIIEYVLRVWIVYVEEACELGRQRIWDLARLKKRSLEFLGQLTSKAAAEKGYDRGGTVYPGQVRRLPEMTSRITGEILPEVMGEFEKSPQWQKYLDLAREVGEAWAANPQKPTAPALQVNGVEEQPNTGGRAGETPDGIPSAAGVVRGDHEVVAARRKAVVDPILETKRWTRSKLAAQAGISKNSVYEYLAGKRRLSDENCKALAEELGLKPQDLPE